MIDTAGGDRLLKTWNHDIFEGAEQIQSPKPARVREQPPVPTGGCGTSGSGDCGAESRGHAGVVDALGK